MKRRRFLSSVGIILPAAMVSTEFFLSSCNADVKEEYFSDKNIKLLDEIGETIIPATASSPGAKEARIGEFMKVYVTDCYPPEEQNIFWEGVNKIKKNSKSKYGNEFPKLALLQKQEILLSLKNESKIDSNTPQFYPMVKDLVVFGFFTSKPGSTKALRYIQTPGYYKGDVPYKKGDKAWAT